VVEGNVQEKASLETALKMILRSKKKVPKKACIEAALMMLMV
jgi:hypothetical protein